MGGHPLQRAPGETSGASLSSIGGLDAPHPGRNPGQKLAAAVQRSAWEGALLTDRADAAVEVVEDALAGEAHRPHVGALCARDLPPPPHRLRLYSVCHPLCTFYRLGNPCTQAAAQDHAPDGSCTGGSSAAELVTAGLQTVMQQGAAQLKTP